MYFTIRRFFPSFFSTTTFLEEKKVAGRRETPPSQNPWELPGSSNSAGGGLLGQVFFTTTPVIGLDDTTSIEGAGTAFGRGFCWSFQKGPEKFQAKSSWI